MTLTRVKDHSGWTSKGDCSLCSFYCDLETAVEYLTSVRMMLLWNSVFWWLQTIMWGWVCESSRSIWTRVGRRWGCLCVRFLTRLVGSYSLSGLLDSRSNYIRLVVVGRLCENDSNLALTPPTRAHVGATVSCPTVTPWPRQETSCWVPSSSPEVCHKKDFK